MELQKLTLHALPFLCFAHKYETAPHVWHLSQVPNMIEITYIEAGDLWRIGPEGQRIHHKAPCLLCYSHDIAWRMETQAPLHRHFTVAFSGTDMIMQTMAISPTESISLPAEDLSHTFFLLFHVTDTGVCNEAAKAIQTIIALHASSVSGHALSEARLILQLLEILAQYARRLLQTQGKRAAIWEGNPYCKKVREYVAEHRHQKIDLQALTRELQVSYGHLSRVVKQNMGCTLVEYIQRIKLDYVKELLLAKHMSLAEAGRYVGIEDTKYLSRLFKKVNGITVTEYRHFLSVKS